MQADPAAQLSLLDLAAIDVQLSQLAHKRGSLPEHGKIAELRGRHQAISEDVVAADTKLSDLASETNRLEADLVPARQRLERNQKRVDDGVITDPKALRSMLDEIEHLGTRISNLEDQELDLMQATEDATAVRDQAVAARNEITTEARDVIAARDKKLAQIDAESAAATGARASLVAKLPADLVALYDKIAARAGSFGAAELRAKRCLGCQLEINAADLRRFSAAGPNDVIRCEECDRILVRTSQSGLAN